MISSLPALLKESKPAERPKNLALPQIGLRSRAYRVHASKCLKRKASRYYRNIADIGIIEKKMELLYYIGVIL